MDQITNAMGGTCNKASATPVYYAGQLCWNKKGNRVRILAVDRRVGSVPNLNPIIGLVDYGDHEVICSWDINGRYCTSNSHQDLTTKAPAEYRGRFRDGSFSHYACATPAEAAQRMDNCHASPGWTVVKIEEVPPANR